MTIARWGANGSNSSTRGYTTSGATNFTFTGSTLTTEIDGMEFSTESAINPSSVMAVNIHSSGCVSSSNGAWFGGGEAGSYSRYQQSEVQGLNFSTETSTNPAWTLAQARRGTTGVNSSVRGYFCGGQAENSTSSYTNYNEIDGVQFSTDAFYNPAVALTVTRSYTSGFNSTTEGYICGGFFLNSGTPPTRTYYSEIDGLNFNTETSINPSASLSTATRSGAGVQSGSL
jgi:hypothetical protein